MKYSDLRDFIAKLKQSGDLVEIDVPVSPNLEMTELCDRTLRASEPALLDRKSTRLNSSHIPLSRMPSSA